MCKRGEVYMVKLPTVKGSIQSGVRPFLIIQNNIGNKYSPTTIGIPLTSRINKHNLPTHVFIPKSIGLYVDSIALCEQIITIDKSLFQNKVCEVTYDIMKQINKALMISIDVA